MDLECSIFSEAFRDGEFLELVTFCLFFRGVGIGEGQIGKRFGGGLELGLHDWWRSITWR